MSDEQLIIRRVCQCGKPAGHESVCRPRRAPAGMEPEREIERVDPAFESMTAERRSERHARRQPGFRAERDSERARMSNAELGAHAAVRAAKLSPISAANVSPSHGTAAHPSTNLALQAGSVDPDTDPRWRAAHDSERRGLLRKHELLDEYEGHGVAQADRDVTSEDKDAEIVADHNQHLSASEFARQFPGYGSPATVSRKRRWHQAGHCTFNGLPPRSGCRCPTCRRATG